MAHYHLRVKFVQRSEGQSSVAAAAYRSCSKFKDEFTGRTHDYTRKGDFEHGEILRPDHVPEWLGNRDTLWNTVETTLNHKRGQPAFEVEVSLPRELAHAQCAQLVREFVQDTFVSKGLIADICIHRPEASDGGEQPHAHILLTTRRWNADGTMAKAARDLQDKPPVIKRVQWLEKNGRFEEAAALVEEAAPHLRSWRKNWADYSNHFLEEAGSAARIDHRTLEAQKIDREPVPNIGAAFHRSFETIFDSMAQRLKNFKDISWRNAVVRQFSRMQDKRPDRMAEYMAQAREYARDLIQGLEPEKEKGADYER